MLSKVSPIMPLSTNIVGQLRKIDDFYVCTRFTEDMIGPPMVSIGNELYFRFMNFIYLPQPPESLTPEQVKKICDVRLEYFDELVNYQLNSSVVDIITDCVVAKYSNPVPLLKALDFGCGSGLSSQMLLNRMPNLDLIGVDISEKAISRCQEQSIKAKLTELGERLPFDTAEFDIVFAVFVMHFNINIPRCHTECCVTTHNEKVLNPVQTRLSGFSAMYHYTTFGMASSYAECCGLQDCLFSMYTNEILSCRGR